MDIIFHIGIPKTASTFLQTEMFPGLNAAGKRQGHKALRARFRDIFTKRDPSFWATRSGQRTVRELLRTPAAQRNPLLYTDEALARRVSFTSRPAPQRTRQPHLVAEHLAAFQRHAWGERGAVKVFFFVRRQPDWLGSAYAQGSQYYQHASQADFERQVMELLEAPGDNRAQALDYALMLETLNEALGDDAVLPLLYEHMQEGEQLRKLGAFIEAERPLESLPAFGQQRDRHNTRRTGGKTWRISSWKPAESWLQHRRRKLSEKLGIAVEHRVGRPDDQQEIRLTPALHEAITEHYRASNQAFSQRTGLALQEAGYF